MLEEINKHKRGINWQGIIMSIYGWYEMILYLRLSLHAHKSFFLANIYEELYMHIIDAQTFGGVGFLLIREIIVSLNR